MGLVEWRLVGEDKDENELTQQAGGKFIGRSVSRWESQVIKRYVRRKCQTQMMMRQEGGGNWERRLT